MKGFKTILLFSIVTMLALTFTGCAKKTALTASDFKSKMASNGYTVEDATNQFDSEQIKQVYLALNDAYQIEFFEASSEAQAISAYKENKALFEASKGSTFGETTNNVSNYSKYTLKSDGKYKVISRIDTTWIYVDADDTYKAEINTVLKELGY
jgi:hypothetical protein